MAKAFKCTVKQVVTTEEPGVSLELTVREANVLAAILSRVGGNPAGYRGDVDNIFTALRSAGIALANRAGIVNDTGVHSTITLN